MDKKTKYEMHTLASLHRRLRGMFPPATLQRWVRDKTIKTYGQRGTSFTFAADELEMLHTEEAKHLLGKLRSYTEFSSVSRDPASMDDDAVAGAYLQAQGDAATALAPELLKRMAGNGYLMAKAIERQIAKNGANFIDTKRGCSTYTAGAITTQRKN